MTKNKKLKNYLEAHPGATVEDYNNQKHKMHVKQASIVTYNKHTGSKNLKVLLFNIHSIPNKARRFAQYFSRYAKQ